jgi:uncharacterized membrane protein YphA (DoxX/SURF4 family)
MFHCCVWSPLSVAKLVTRVLFGITLACVGISHYFMGFEEYRELVRQGLEGIPMQLADGWAYVLPALMIVGGVLLVLQVFPVIAAAVVALALGSISTGMLLKSVIGTLSLAESMPAAANTFVWLIVFLLATSGKHYSSFWTALPGCSCAGSCKTGCCGKGHGSEKNCMCGSKDCPECGVKVAELTIKSAKESAEVFEQEKGSDASAKSKTAKSTKK